jgi:small multidrug resistance family-3 protein
MAAKPATAVLWLWVIERRVPDRWDVIGALVAIAGMLMIAFGPHDD